jgi:hypothetical protein
VKCHNGHGAGASRTSSCPASSPGALLLLGFGLLLGSSLSQFRTPPHPGCCNQPVQAARPNLDRVRRVKNSLMQQEKNTQSVSAPNPVPDANQFFLCFMLCQACFCNMGVTCQCESCSANALCLPLDALRLPVHRVGAFYSPSVKHVMQRPLCCVSLSFPALKDSSWTPWMTCSRTTMTCAVKGGPAEALVCG